jgi:hypothetical protein
MGVIQFEKLRASIENFPINGPFGLTQQSINLAALKSVTAGIGYIEQPDELPLLAQGLDIPSASALSGAATGQPHGEETDGSVPVIAPPSSWTSTSANPTWRHGI